mmetsp:Transcript_20830/g.25511  ORF Transcript_20830/g.25511 Transcript_20830/m.25511 type:complete len:243 (+) Transcript_20830:44-772(+)
MVESDNKNKGLFLGIAAATAVVGAALLYHFVFAGDDEEESGSSHAQVMRELTEAGLEKVKKTPDNTMLDPKYMLQLLNFVTKTGRTRRETARNEALDERLRLYKEGKDDEYRELVKQQFEADDQMCQQVMQELMAELTETNEQEFSMTMQVMAQQPQFQQMLMAAQQGKLPEEDAAEKAKAAPALSKQKTLTAFELTKKHTMEALGKQADMQKAAASGQVNEMDLMIDMFVEQAKIDDDLFI